MMSDTVIVTYAKHGRENYPSGLPRLVQSARDAGYVGDFILCSPDSPELIGGELNERELPIPAHADVPYGFKTHLIKIARDRGYSHVFWFDSTIFVVQNYHKLIHTLKDNSVLLFDNPGCPEATWTSDDCLAQIGCSHETAKTFNQVMACAMGFDFTTRLANDVFDIWFNHGQDGVSFKGVSGSSRPDFNAHRHDQSVISFVAHSKGIPKIPYGFLSYWDDREKFNSIICNRGIGQP